MPDLATIDIKTRGYAKARERLAEQVRNLTRDIEQIRAAYRHSVQQAVDDCANTFAELEADLAASPELFVSPRSITLYGIKIGWQRNPGRIEIDDPLRCIDLIRKHLPEQAETLIRTYEQPVRKAIAALPAAQARRIGCTIVGATDTVLIKPTDGEIDKLVDALLGEALAAAEPA